MDVNHPITDLPFDYEHTCNTCAHFTDKRRTLRGIVYFTTKCALDPQQRNLATDVYTKWKSLPACVQHRPSES